MDFGPYNKGWQILGEMWWSLRLLDRRCQTNAAIRRRSWPNTVARCRQSTTDRHPDAGHHRPDSTAHRPDTSCRQLFSFNIILSCFLFGEVTSLNVHVAPIHINDTFIYF